MDGKTYESQAVVVIGAGASGLAVAQALQVKGIRAVVLEKGGHIGESWFHRHPQLTLNTHRSTSSLPGLPYPKSVGAFPTRLELIDYLRSYVETFAIDVRINAGVSKIQFNNKSETPCWELETDKECYRTRHLVIATGFDQIPYIPEWPSLGLYQKPYLHAANFGKLNDYTDKNVLVVGGGNSGVDVLNHLSRINTGKTWLSVRQGSVIIPSRVLGIPIQPSAMALEKLPVPIADRLLSLTERLCFGDLRRYRLNRTRNGAVKRLLAEGVAPAIDNGFVKALKAGKVSIVPGIQYFTENSVVFAGGEEIVPDVILFATGYRTNLTSLLGEFDVLDTKGEPRFHGSEQHSSLPGLWFTGLRLRLPGFFLAAGETGGEIATAIATSLAMASTNTIGQPQLEKHTSLPSVDMSKE
ncbi:MAG: NAD(P)/FAD-dependent oxidoreductase [Pseudomonadales bacterium]|nr:NAD(P)/FAD-dependent oxidoreductase [Pseudomonadales bacterium]